MSETKIPIEQEQFKQDMEEAGFEVELYRGRNFYKGYAARGDLTRALQATHVPTQWDSMGMGKIFYPAKSMTDEEYQKASEMELLREELDL